MFLFQLVLAVAMVQTVSSHATVMENQTAIPSQECVSVLLVTMVTVVGKVRACMVALHIVSGVHRASITHNLKCHSLTLAIMSLAILLYTCTCLLLCAECEHGHFGQDCKYK